MDFFNVMINAFSIISVFFTQLFLAIFHNVNFYLMRFKISFTHHFDLMLVENPGFVEVQNKTALLCFIILARFR